MNSFCGQNLLKINSFLPWLVSSLEYFPHSNFQKRIVSAENIRGNTVILYPFLGNFKTHFAITMSGALHNCAEHNAMGSKVLWVSILLLLMHLCTLVKYAVIKWVIMKLNFLFFHCPLFKMKNANLISINRYAFVKNNTGYF